MNYDNLAKDCDSHFVFRVIRLMMGFIQGEERMKNTKILEFLDFDSFIKWLEINHKTANEAHILIYKKNARKNGITYEEAVQAALCYGWIDSIRRSYNTEKFLQRFSPRKAESSWSISNIKRMQKLISEGLVREEGLTYFDMALIDQLDSLVKEDQRKKSRSIELPEWLKEILKATPDVLEKYNQLPPSHKRQYIQWIESAKKEDTKFRRAQKMKKMLLEDRPIYEL